MKRVLIIGSSGGIGRALSELLLDQGWSVVGISRSPAAFAHERYRHHVADVRDPDYRDVVRRACEQLRLGAPADAVSDATGEAAGEAAGEARSSTSSRWLDTCVYCAGVGESLELDQLERERTVFEINLMGAVATVEVVLPMLLAAGSGHIVGLSSQADELRNPDAPSYAASKAGMSVYLESMARAVRARGVHITNVRFGFVDTKMARSESKPFLISAERAAALIERCMRRRPIRFTSPRRMAALLWLVRRFQ